MSNLLELSSGKELFNELKYKKPNYCKSIFVSSKSGENGCVIIFKVIKPFIFITNTSDGYETTENVNINDYILLSLNNEMKPLKAIITKEFSSDIFNPKFNIYKNSSEELKNNYEIIKEDNNKDYINFGKFKENVKYIGVGKPKGQYRVLCEFDFCQESYPQLSEYYKQYNGIKMKVSWGEQEVKQHGYIVINSLDDMYLLNDQEFKNTYNSPILDSDIINEVWKKIEN